MARITRQDAIALGIPGVTRPNKFHAVRCELDGFTFDSKAERDRYALLALAQRAGTISHLSVHRKFPITLSGKLVGYYEADFDYRHGGNFIVEDVKGHRTALYMFKKKCFAAQYPHALFKEVRLCRGSRSTRRASTTIGA